MVRVVRPRELVVLLLVEELLSQLVTAPTSEEVTEMVMELTLEVVIVTPVETSPLAAAAKLMGPAGLAVSVMLPPGLPLPLKLTVIVTGAPTPPAGGVWGT